GGCWGACRLGRAHYLVLEFVHPLGGNRHDISSFCYLTVVRACYGPDGQFSPSDLTKKRATFGPLSHAAVDRARVAPPESLTTVGDYAIFHWVRSRLGAGLPRSPQDSPGPKRCRTLTLLIV